MKRLNKFFGGNTPATMSADKHYTAETLSVSGEACSDAMN